MSRGVATRKTVAKRAPPKATKSSKSVASVKRANASSKSTKSDNALNDQREMDNRSPDDSTTTAPIKTPKYLQGKSSDRVKKVLENHRLNEKKRYDSLNSYIAQIGSILPQPKKDEHSEVLNMGRKNGGLKMTNTLLQLVCYLTFLERRILEITGKTRDFFILENKQKSVLEIIHELSMRQMRQVSTVKPSRKSIPKNSSQNQNPIPSQQVKNSAKPFMQCLPYFENCRQNQIKENCASNSAKDNEKSGINMQEIIEASYLNSNQNLMDLNELDLENFDNFGLMDLSTPDLWSPERNFLSGTNNLNTDFNCDYASSGFTDSKYIGEFFG